ncbi:hypothetical protein FRC00_001290 [Tulasnella sp. 408]|nr:hypothetical protein FRC00_001290 [Tulasnella sp. 408]
MDYGPTKFKYTKLTNKELEEIRPLVIEDVLHGRQTYSSKADCYNKHLLLRMLCHTLTGDDDSSPNVIESNPPPPASTLAAPTPLSTGLHERIATLSETQRELIINLLRKQISMRKARNAVRSEDRLRCSPTRIAR